jgi:predicted MFS family arabinose efflux permease
VGGLAGFGAGIMLFAISPTPWLAAVALALAGFAFLGAITSVTTRMQQDVSEDVRGRIMALWGVAFLGSRPLAALINGAVADALGPRPASALAAAAALIGALVLSQARHVPMTERHG